MYGSSEIQILNATVRTGSKNQISFQLGFYKQVMKPMALTLQTRYSLSMGFNQYLVRNKFTRNTYVCIQQI
jgi:hypothetical protein